MTGMGDIIFQNLLDIVQRDDHEPGERRVVEFAIDDEGNRLVASECCDDWYAIALEPAEVDKLIAWLCEARRQIGGVS